jgi:hypothetical protein
VRLTGAIAVGLVAAVAAGGAAAVEAKKKIKPAGGGYAGKVTNKNGHGAVRLVYARFAPSGGGKARTAVQLFDWHGTLKCTNGSKRDGSAGVTAPLHGLKFSGHSSSNTQTVSLSGRFTSATRLKGTARMTTQTGPTKCHTGPVTFKAHHT